MQIVWIFPGSDLVCAWNLLSESAFAFMTSMAFVPLCNKQIVVMKKIFRLVTALGLFCGAFAFTGCNYEDDINSLGDRLSAVESSLQSLEGQISDGAVITGVTSSESGVVITLSNGESYTITNGTNGTPGSVVTIGADGYWYIDGVKTDYPAKGQEGQPGQPGDDANTVYYYPHESGYWYKVTVTPEGTKTEEATTISWIASSNGVTAVYNPEDGTLTLANVEGADKPIVISLTSQLKSLAFVPETMAQGLGVIQFYSLYDAKGAFIAANQPEVTYRVNPANADLANVEWAFINREVTTKVAGDNTDLISIVGEPVAGEKGGVVFTITANSDKEIPSDASVKGDNVLVALQATSTDSEEEVVSDYAFVEQVKIDEYQIIKHDPYYKKVGKEVIPYEPTDDYKVLPDLSDPTNIILGYNETINVFDSLETYVPTTGVKKSLPELYVEPSYKLSFPEKYLGADGKTNQQQFVTLDEETGNLSVNSEWLGNNRPAIGRTPVIFAEAFVKNTKGEDVKVAQCWLKVNIIGEKAVIEDHNVTVAPATIEYSKIPDAGEKIALSWEQANKDILAALDLTYNEFVALYDVNAADVTVTYYDDKGVQLKTAPAGVSASISGLSDNTATNAAEVKITDKVDENLSGSVKVEIPSVEPNSRGNVIVNFSYTVKHDHVWPELSANYLKPGTTNTVVVKGKLINNAWEMQSTMAEHFEGYLSDYGAAYAKNKENHGPITFALMPYISKDEAAKNGKVVSVATPQAEWPKGYVDQLGADISGTDYTDQEIALTEPLVNNKTYVVTAYTVLDNGNYCEMTYYVEFVSPFEVTGKDIELKTLIADPSTEDVQELLVVNDLDGKVVYEKGAVTKYGADTYKLDDADFVFNYELIFKDKDHADLNPESDFNGDGVDHLSMNGSEVTWDNAGTTLQQDMHAAYSIELKVSDICVIDSEAGITVLSSANSK